MASTRGRQVVVPLTNKAGVSVANGDVVVVDTANDDSFTTTTTAAFTGQLGIAQETIASNAVGRVLLSGKAELVNVNAAVTRGHYGATHTVAKQAADAGATRALGTFCQFTTGGTTPKAIVWPVDGAAGSGGGGGTSTVIEMDYAQFTAPVSPTATTEATANTVVTGNAVTYDGTTPVEIEFYAPWARPDPSGGADLTFYLFDGSTSLGVIALVRSVVAANQWMPVSTSRRLTPSAGAHTYSVRAAVSAGTASIQAGAGGAGNTVPGFIRITRVATYTPPALAGTSYQRSAGAYTTSSTSFTDVDGTNLALTITTGAHRILVGVTCSVEGTAGDTVEFDILVDTVSQSSATRGIMSHRLGITNYRENVSFTWLTTAALSAASHTVKLQWRNGISSNTLTMHGASASNLMQMWVAEQPF